MIQAQFQHNLEQVYSQMVAWRRYLHQHPEVSFHEIQTAEYIHRQLEALGLQVNKHIAGHGCTAIIEGAHSGPVIALRADIDALPIQDIKTTSYASQNSGVMHACGHDGHVAGLLGAAAMLMQMKEQLHGKVKLIFQPAEEKSPGGAKPMIDEGVLDGVDVIYGVHLWSPLPYGQITTCPGAMMAIADQFEVTIRGKGGHGGLPHKAIDSVVIASHLVVNLQTITSRLIDPSKQAVLTIGLIQSGATSNVIASECYMRGTVRVFDEETKQVIKQAMQQIAEHTCSMFGAQVDFRYMDGYPAVVNDNVEAARVLRVAREQFGDEAVQIMQPTTVAEDFAYFLQEVPGSFIFVGAGNEEQGIVAPHHHPAFDIDERALKHAAQLFVSLVLDYQREWKGSH